MSDHTLPPEVEEALLCVPLEAGNLEPFTTIFDHLTAQAEEIANLKAGYGYLPALRKQRDEYAEEIERRTSRLEALEAEHRAVKEIVWRKYLRSMKPLDPDWTSDIDRLFHRHDHAERVMKGE
ncbi:MAG: hypothetical protein RQ731_08080 [Anaerosomatales bacterium]|nr:hypothetical protein [Anaerosomatales bacterium]